LTRTGRSTSIDPDISSLTASVRLKSRLME
jgi:hypothetical protein